MQPAAAGGRPPVLVVDLDGTLLRGDLLAECATRYLVRHFQRAGRLALWAAQGPAQLKQRLADAVDIDVAALPYRASVLDLIRGERARGRRIVLATASNRRVAEQVAAQLDLFDEVLASDATVNLKGETKRDALVARFGRGGFDYAGDAAADVPVWSAAAGAWLVAPSAATRAEAAQATTVLGTLDAEDARPRARLAAAWRALRPHQWLKNLLVLLPLAAAHRYASAADVLRAAVALASFCLCASSVYLFNDLCDLADDRHHPRKRRRPLASGALPLATGWTLVPLLLAAGVVLAATSLPSAYLGILGTYYLVTLAYSFGLKRILLVDVIVLGGLYTIRIVAGAAAVEVALSFWLLTFSGFLFMSLALVKRYSELARTVAVANAAPADPAPALRGRGYRAPDLAVIAMLGIAAGYCAVLVLALYVQDPATAVLYIYPKAIWLACPLLLYWISRVWMLAQRGALDEDPVVFALGDRLSWMVAIAVAMAFAVARPI
jgi:4-hydroxybenzoate polyprenyltransferase/phosphoserine phosphatase